MAGNPIDMSIMTQSNASSDPLKKLESIQLEIKGAMKIFPGDINWSDPEHEQYLGELARKSIIELDKKIGPNTGVTYFSGSAKDLTYNRGGTYDIGVTWVLEGRKEPEPPDLIKDAIQISPSEVLHTIRNNSIMLGLALITIGIAFIIPGLFKFLQDYNSDK